MREVRNRVVFRNRIAFHNRIALRCLWTIVLAAAWAQAQSPAMAPQGQGPSNDWSNVKPGDRHHVRAADLPSPSPQNIHRYKVVPRPQDAWPMAPAGFKVEQVATGLENPRRIACAPNGDLFIAESEAGKILVLRMGPDGKESGREVFADGLRLPYGIAFYPPGANPRYLYVANTDSVVRFPYARGGLKAGGKPEIIVPELPAGKNMRSFHWTRDLAFSRDGKKLYVSIGSRDDFEDSPEEAERARIVEFHPDGSGRRVYATGIRNATGIATHPQTGELWASVNERNRLGDDLVPDYTTHVTDGGFYGWPWYYIGPHADTRIPERPELKDKVLTPDVLYQSHSAPLSFTFYTGRSFPKPYREGAFVALHGSSQRSQLSGYKIVFLPAPGGRATGEYVDFVTGMVMDDTQVWGRPVGVAVARDGSLLFSDDASNSLWRVRYVGGGKSSAKGGSGQE